MLTGCYSGKSIGSKGGLTGKVVEMDGTTPVPGAQVKFVAGDTTEMVNTKQDGTFIVSLKAGQAYQVVASVTGYQSGVVTSPCILANKTLDLGVITLRGLGRLIGRITDRNGAPLSGGIVQVIDSSGNVVATGIADASGNVVIDNIPQGIYTVVITSSDGSLTVTLPNVVIAPNATMNLGTVVALPQGDGGLSVIGKVLDENLSLLGGVKVSFKDVDTGQTIKSLISQEATEGLENNITETVPGGNYLVYYSRSGYHSFTLYGQKIASNPTFLPTVRMVSVSEATGGLKG